MTGARVMRSAKVASPTAQLTTADSAVTSPRICVREPWRSRRYFGGDRREPEAPGDQHPVLADRMHERDQRMIADRPQRERISAHARQAPSQPRAALTMLSCVTMSRSCHATRVDPCRGPRRHLVQ